MSWGRIDDTLHTHDKAQEAGLEAMGLWVMALSRACALDSPEGFTSRAAVIRFCKGSARKAETLAACLVRAGLWEVTEGGWTFHDWSTYQLTKVAREELSAKRSAAGKLGAAATNSRKTAEELNAGSASAAAPSEVSDAAKVVYYPSHPIPSQPKEEIPPTPRRARVQTDDGCGGMAVDYWREGVRSVTNQIPVLDRGDTLHLVDLVNTHCPTKDPNGKCDWAKRDGAAYAKAMAGFPLSPKGYGRWVAGNRQSGPQRGGKGHAKPSGRWDDVTDEEAAEMDRQDAIARQKDPPPQPIPAESLALAAMVGKGGTR